MGKTVKFGIIGCGLMGREFGSAAARWSHIGADIPQPEIVAVCDVNAENTKWFSENIPTVTGVYSEYGEMLRQADIEAVYVAVPHNLHQDVYCAVLQAGKHLLGEKPFGMDAAQNAAILAEAAKHPGLIVRCASEYPYFPAMQVMIDWIREGKFGRILEVRAGFRHSSDMNPDKPINWKRMVKFNGEYGCMGDLGIHTHHVPFRMGFQPVSVYAMLSKYIEKRSDGKGGFADCDTWDNATMICKTRDKSGNEFPMYLETKRMSPGATNDWYFEIDGMDCSAKFSTHHPNTFTYSSTWGNEQAWASIDIGYKPMIPTITGSIFEFGFTDSILQMWAAFMSELDGKDIPFGCFTLEETALSHKLCTSALQSQREGKEVIL